MTFAHAGLYADSLAAQFGGQYSSGPVSVYISGTSTLATLYTDRTKVATVPNPTATDVLGNLSFYADPGLYDLVTPSSAPAKVITVSIAPDVADAGAITSVFGRSGVVTAQTGDYTPAQVGAQPADPTLTALAGLPATAGLVVQTAADVFTARQLAAGSTSVQVTNPAGVAGNPTVDVVPANFTGIPEAGVTNLVTDLAAKVPTSRQITVTGPLTGGGTLAADRTIGISLAATDIPALDTAKITSGVFVGARLPDLEIPNYFSGGWWCVPDVGTSTTNTMTNNQVNLMCIAPSRDCTLAGLMIEISTADSSGTVRIGLATDANGVPGTWLDDYGTIVATSIGFFQPPTTPSRALTAGTRYWVGVAGQGLTAGLVLRGRSGWDRRVPLTQSATPALFNTSRNCWFANGVSGAFSGALTLSGTPGAGVMVGAKLT